MPERKSVSPTFILAALLLVFSLAASGQQAPQSGAPEKQERPSPPTANAAGTDATLVAIEQALFDSVNRERASRSLAAVKLSPALARLARAHSADMAGRGVLGHASADGKSYTQRLEAASVLFAANGENVASSSVPDPVRIHSALMKTGGHRENILRSDFDELGVGAARGADGTYYVTQDFIKGVPVRDEAEVRAFVLAALDWIRKSRGLAPLLPSENVHRTAQAFARARSEGRAYPEIPREYGETRVDFYAGPDLDALAAAMAEDPVDRFTLAGVGAAFARTPEHRGGAYFVCVFLLVGDPRP
jgi:uncharacterized protein YkwD